jgi:hypothetical protein
MPFSSINVPPKYGASLTRIPESIKSVSDLFNVSVIFSAINPKYCYLEF